MKMSRFLAHSIATLLVAPFAGNAAVFTWDGGGANDLIATAANWNPDGAPPSDLTNTDLQFGGLVRLTPSFGSAFAADSIAFLNTAGAFVLGGSALTIGTGGIANSDTQTQTINNVVTLGTATSSFQAISGGLAFGGALSLGANSLSIGGANATTFNNSINGTGSITKTGAGLLQIVPTATAIGADLTINAGTLLFSPSGSSQVFSSTSTVALAAGTMTLNESVTFDGGAQFTRASGTTVNISAGKTLTFQGGSDATITSAFSHATASTIVVTGAGSSFTTTGPLTLNSGAAIHALSGGAVSAGSNTITIGNGGSAELLVGGSGASLTGGALSLAPSGAGTLTFSSGSTGSLAGISVNNAGLPSGNGNLSVLSGANVTGASLNVSALAAAGTVGVIVIDGAGSTLTLTGAAASTIGALTGTGTVAVQNSGVFNGNSGLLTVNATGTLGMTGGTFNANGDVTIAGGQLTRDLSGVFNLAAGKTLTLQAGGDAAFTGVFTQAVGANFTVTDAGSTLSGSSSLNFNGGSVVNVAAGGSVTMAAGVLGIGTTGGGVMTVSGTGSNVNGATLSVGGSGAGSNGSLTFSNNSTGLFQSMFVGNSSTPGTIGALTIQSGADVTGSALVIAPNSNAVSGTVTVDGPGSTLNINVTTNSTIGATTASAATLNIQNNGAFNSGGGSVTVQPTGVVNVTTGGTFNGQGDLIFNGGDIDVGPSSSFTLASGKIMTVRNGSVASFASSVAFESSNTVTVRGVGSALTQTGGANLRISGGSSLSVIEGGTLSTVQYIDVGTVAGSLSVLLADGAGSSVTSGPTLSFWGAGSGSAFVEFRNGSSGNFGSVAMPSAGAGSSGVLSIHGGADVAMLNLTIAASTDTITGTATVSGAGSTLTLLGASALTVGAASGSAGALNVNTGGAFTSGTGNVTINPTGTLNIGGGTVTLLGPFAQNGTLNFTSGALSIIDSWNVGAGGLLGANVTLDAARRMTTSATTTIDAFQTLTLTGGTLTTAVLVNNGVIDFQKGTLAVTGAGGLTIGGSGPVGNTIVLGTGANLQVTNSASVASGASLTLNGGTFTAGAFTNAGTLRANLGLVSIASGSNQSGARIFVGDTIEISGAFTNALGARITLQGGSGLISGGGSLINSGLLTGSGTVAKALTNSASGEVRADLAQTLSFTDAASNLGAFNLLGGALDFSSSLNNAAGGFISGYGALFTGGLTNAGNIAISGGNLALRGDVTNSAGARIVTSGGATTTFFDDVVHNGTEIRTSAGSSTVFLGAVSGAGPFTGTGTVYFEGDLRPGNSPASVLYEGDLVLGSAATLTLELGGLLAGLQHDRLLVGGLFHQDGDLSVTLLNGFAPRFGDTFDLFDAGRVAGGFDTIDLPALAGDLTWDATALPSTGQLRVVPEPGIGTLLMAALSLLGWRRSRATGRRALDGVLG